MVDDDYLRRPMPVSGGRQPLRVAQFEAPAYGTPPASDFAPAPIPNQGAPLAPFQGNWTTPGGVPNYSGPASPAYQPPSVPGYQTPGYPAPAGPAPFPFPGGVGPAPFPASPLTLNPAASPQAVDGAAMFGGTPLSPYSQSTDDSDPVDYDLIIGATPSSQTTHYWAGLGFNSDLGLFGQFIYDERDFDLHAPPWRNVRSPFRGGGQRLRIEAMPGAEAQRYLVSFTEPYFTQFGGRPVSLNVSGFFFDRDFFEWDERRFGGRVGFGYDVSQNLSLQAKFRIEDVRLTDPRLVVPELARSLGDSELYGIGLSLAYDTRDSRFLPSEGAYLGLGAEYVFGSFEYPRANVNYQRYSWIRQRADGSGRHIIGLHFDGSITGDDTPIYENYFAGGYSTLRGFRFRHASPKEMGVIVGGELSLLGSAEYLFPVTADDMVRGLFFCDLGTVEESTSVNSDNLRVSLGGGFRISVPALGPAPLAIDLAVPVKRADGDRVQNVAFFISVGR